MKFVPDIRKLEAFVYYHLNHRMEFPIGDFHKQLMKQFQHPRVAIAAPRGHAKSTWASFFYPLYVALEHPGTSILLVSATAALAKHWLAEIRKEFEGNESLREFYGKIESTGKWNEDILELKNGSRIWAKGSGNQLRGFGPDLIIGDDLETDEMVVSPTQRNDFDKWFWATLMGTARGKDIQVIIVGTILHTDSFLSDLINHGREGWLATLYQACDEKLTESLWPDMWPIEVLRTRKKEMGDYAFAQEYMNDPIPDDMRTFQDKWLRYYTEPPKGCAYFTTIDPAIEIGAKNDCTAIVTCAIDRDENIYVVETINKKFLPSETVDCVFDVYKRWTPQVMGIETVAAQKLFKYELDRERKRRKVFPNFRELSSGGRRKSLRIEALQPRFQQGKIFIREDMVELKTQLLRFPSPRCHDDLIDALAYQLDIIRPASKEQVYVNPDSFIASIERKRRNSGNGKVWGNHRVRNNWI